MCVCSLHQIAVSYMIIAHGQSVIITHGGAASTGAGSTVGESLCTEQHSCTDGISRGPSAGVIQVCQLESRRTTGELTNTVIVAGLYELMHKAAPEHARLTRLHPCSLYGHKHITRPSEFTMLDIPPTNWCYWCSNNSRVWIQI